MTAKKNGRKCRKHMPHLKDPKVVFDDNDVERVLKAMGSKYSLEKRQRLLLKREINRSLAFSRKSYQSREYHARRKVIDYCKRIQVAVAEITAVLRDIPNVRYELAKEADRFPPCSSEIRPHRRAIPSVLAHAQVTEAERGISQIALWAKHREAWANERSTRLGKKRAADLIRYRLILCWADLFTRIFGELPSATLDGPWCLFLKEVLDISEGNSLSIGSVYDIWSKARRWRTQVRGRPMPEDDFAWEWAT